MHRPKAIFVQSEEYLNVIYGPDVRREIRSLVNLCHAPQTPESLAADPSVLNDVELLFTGWGAPAINKAVLDAAPKLEVIFYAGGTAASIVGQELWRRGIRLTSAYAANGVPVAEYCLAMILLSLKHVWRYAMTVRQRGTYPQKWDVPGAYGSTVGLVSIGTIGRQLCQMLKPFDVKVIAYDPFLSAAEAKELGIDQLVTLDEVFIRSDVVSLHTPLLAETVGLIHGKHFRLMKQGASFINTARGMIVQEEAMIEVARQRTDMQFFLDTVCPEPPDEGSPLYSLPNVMLTPHIAGSMSGECRRMGRYMAEELKRYLAGSPLKWEITPALAVRSSHRPSDVAPSDASLKDSYVLVP